MQPNYLPLNHKDRGAALTNGQCYEKEYRMKRKDGHYRWQLMRVIPLKDGQGKIIKWFGTCTDIDKQKRTQLASQDAGERRASGTQSSSLTSWASLPAECCRPQQEGSAIAVSLGPMTWR